MGLDSCRHINAGDVHIILYTAIVTRAETHESRNTTLENPTLSNPVATLAVVSISAHHDGRAVDPSHGDETPRHVLVAAGDGDVAIVPLPPHDRLDGIGDNVS